MTWLFVFSKKVKSQRYVIMAILKKRKSYSLNKSRLMSLIQTNVTFVEKDMLSQVQVVKTTFTTCTAKINAIQLTEEQIISFRILKKVQGDPKTV